MNALEKNAVTESFQKMGKDLPRPKAILAVSAHWETEGTQVLSIQKPPTIHDFYGFPKALFDVEYPAQGSPELARKTQTLIPGSTLSEKWGLDHGTWSVLVHMYPNADIPVYQLSLDVKKTPEQHLEVGKQIAALRDEGVLIVGSGNIVHNLRAINWKEPQGAYQWAYDFDQKIKTALEQRDEKTLTHIEELGDIAKLSVPTADHYLPLLYVVGATTAEDTMTYPFQGYSMGSLSMRSVLYS
jgi:4,5-DOPA dioxygenase extradiol